MTLEINHTNDLLFAAEKLLAFDTKVFLFYGEMGTGKTTFIKSICQKLGVDDTVSSPTFSIVNEYISPGGSIFHFDFYRLKTETEAMDLGFEEYLYSGNYCFIEWPEKVPNLLPDHAVNVNITITGDQERLLNIECY